MRAVNTVIYDGYVQYNHRLSVDCCGTHVTRLSRLYVRPSKAAHRNWMADTTHLQMLEDDNFRFRYL